MDETHDDRLGVYYIKDTKTLLLGIPSPQLKATEHPRVVAMVPFGMILRNSKVKIKDIETLSITTADNFEIIAELEDAKESLWQDFLEYRKNKQEKIKNNVLKFPTDEV